MPETEHQSPSQHQSQDAKTPFRYNAQFAQTIERASQERWEQSAVFETKNPGDDGFDATKPKFYAMDMFPYPSAAGLHVGHPLGYIATDIVSRYKRMKGFNVLHPMGWDAFGLPAEQYAIKTGVHPAETTSKAIDNFRRQLKRFGFSYDWSREVSTIDPGYYKWTQWIWLQMYGAYYDRAQKKARPIATLVEEFERDEARSGSKGEVLRRGDKVWGGARPWDKLTDRERRDVIDGLRLAYLGEQTVNWCPKLGTVLANEEIIDGKSERGGFPVVRRPMRQWMFRITSYADRLLAGLADLDWPESTRTMQREWIGRSEGAYADFACGKRRVRVYTTRPDTLYGATYMVLAPEHPLVDELIQEKYGDSAPKSWRAQGFPGAQELVAKGASPREVADAYRAHVAGRSDVDRQEAKDKSGVFIGAYAINPATDERVPVFIADYVMMGYGTGAIMAVPAHDTRDFEFASLFGLPIKDVVYSGTLNAMKYFFDHVTEGEARSERWFWLLADLLGIVTPEGAEPVSYADALERARNTRSMQVEPPKADVDASTLEKDVPGIIGERRGVVRMQWMEAIESMGFETFQEGKAWFDEGVVHQSRGEAYTSEGFAVNSGPLDGMRQVEAKTTVTKLLEQKKLGEHAVQFRLRDWLFSRQRYWGEPFPIVFDEAGDHHAVADDRLPVELPVLDDYTPPESDDPTPLLGKATDWVRTTAGAAGVTGLPPEAIVTRETNTMPGWAGSCWYYLRYMDPQNHARITGEEAERYWTSGGGVDLYIGGAEHAVLHLLYARFWHMALFDLGHVSTPEPFQKLFHQGLITSFAYQRADKSLVPIDEVEERDGAFVETATGEGVTQTVAKMSKTLRNVVNPDEMIAGYGADTTRLYEMYMGPLDQSKPWNTDDISGMYRFLQRVWRLVVSEESGEMVLRDTPDESTEKMLHRTVAKVGDDIERLAFNTAIAAMIELVNHASKAGGFTADQTERFARILSPFAPHLCEELWSKLGKTEALALVGWPEYDRALLVDDEVEVPVQIMGKVRARITVAAGLDQKALEEAALADVRVQELLEGKTVRKVIVVPGKLVNIVAN